AGGARGAEHTLRWAESWAQKQISVPPISYANGQNPRYAIATSQIVNVFGLRFSFEAALGAFQALQRDFERTGYVHLPDLQGFLRDELQAAYQFLAEPCNRQLWTAFCTPELVAAIRSQQWDLVLQKRREYRDLVRVLTGSKMLYYFDEKGQFQVS